MSKRPDRPWESSDASKNGGGDPWEDQLARARAVLDAPSLMVDGIRYWSDRFYLNHVEGDPLQSISKGSDGDYNSCTCGAKQPPPLLSRERLLKSLDLKACILGTFTLDIAWLTEAFPQLVGPHATVPTLILHGSKKVHTKERTTVNELDDDSEGGQETSPLFCQSVGKGNNHHSIATHDKLEASSTMTRNNDSSIPFVEFLSTDLLTIATEQQTCNEESSTSPSSSSSLQSQPAQNTERTRKPYYRSAMDPTEIDEYPPPSDARIQPLLAIPEALAPASRKENVDPGKLCSTTYVLSAWNKPNERANTGVSYEPMITENGASKASCNRELKRGVFHPKFMILFETSGDVVIMVSTANLTKTRTIEGTWVQRFHPNRRYQEERKRVRQQPNSASVQKTTPLSPSATKRNDFGLVLQDFLEKLDAAAVVGDTRINDFLCTHLESPLGELAKSFYFDRAQVHLVPVVPGDWEDLGTTKKATSKTLLPLSYGRQRVRDILQRKSLLKSNKDRLIVQPTSFGANWTRRQMADIVRSYLNITPHSDGAEDDAIDYWDEEALLQRMDIVWPSRTYMRNACRGENQKSLSPNNVEKAPHEDTEPEASFVFMSSNAFNSCDQSCITRLARFQLSDPPQCPSALVPHFKSIGRLVTKQSAVRILGSSSSTAQEYFSWFLLTSACLSHGAQGKRVQDIDPPSTKKEKVQYANFELGVLFTSCIHPSEPRLYTFAPHQCSCQSLFHQKFKLIHLPVPYSLHPKPFMVDEDDSMMQETPFFHEIDDGTRCVGNMLLTPLGLWEAKKTKSRMKRKEHKLTINT